MEKLKNIPSLRFPEFDGEWEIKQLGEIGEINPSNKNLPNKFIYIDLESVENGQLLKENEVLKNEAPSRAQRILVKNDILFQMVRPYQMNNLFFDKEGVFVASTGYAQIRTESNPRFLYQYLHLQKFVDKVIERCTGTSYPSINSTDLSKISISLPEFTEQTKIATFLTAVDDKLQALKQKKTLLEQYKKGVMQKIFSQELRFKDDNGNDYPDWEEKKLGDTLNITIDNRGKTPPTLDHGIPLLEVNSIGNKNIKYNAVSKFVSELTFETWFRKHLKEGDVLFSTVGNTALCSYYDGNIKACIAQNIVGLRFNTEVGLFMYYLLIEDKNNNKFKQIEMGAVQPSVKVSQMIDLYFEIPSTPEQTKIANFLSAIDDKINHCQSQIEKMDVWKKGLLQQMFV